MRHRTYAVSALFIITGGVLVACGITLGSMPSVIAGVALCISSQLIACMHVLHRWITNVTAERAALADARQRLDQEAAKYSAGLLALAAERGRIQRDAITAASRRDATLKAEREALQAEFEEGRAELISRAMETALRLKQSGALDEPAARERVIVPFPQQPADYERIRERGRDVIP
ncbi:hypothetical protein ACFY40_11340 [Streptomyces sp. NPDC012950]|uniref:hypothetical protein n=1 Tax=Streptomyces sp. NPDC012950 TaxID=3364858 RepID=UPI0036ACFD1B